MRWQKTARLAIAIAVVVFTAVVLIALRRNRPVIETAAEIERTPDTVHESRGGIRFTGPRARSSSAGRRTRPPAQSLRLPLAGR